MPAYLKARLGNLTKRSSNSTKWAQLTQRIPACTILCRTFTASPADRKTRSAKWRYSAPYAQASGNGNVWPVASGGRIRRSRIRRPGNEVNHDNAVKPRQAKANAMSQISKATQRNSVIEFAYQRIRSLGWFAESRKHHSLQTGSFWMLAPVLSLLAFVGGGNSPIKNGGFEAATPKESWQIDPDEAKEFSLTLDKADVKEGAKRCWFQRTNRCNSPCGRKCFFRLVRCGG